MRHIYTHFWYIRLYILLYSCYIFAICGRVFATRAIGFLLFGPPQQFHISSDIGADACLPQAGKSENCKSGSAITLTIRMYIYIYIYVYTYIYI